MFQFGFLKMDKVHSEEKTGWKLPDSHSGTDSCFESDCFKLGINDEVLNTRKCAVDQLTGN